MEVFLGMVIGTLFTVLLVWMFWYDSAIYTRLWVLEYRLKDLMDIHKKSESE